MNYEVSAKAADWIIRSGRFDPLWYKSNFKDVDHLEMTAEDHYRKVGRLIGRAPSPDKVSIELIRSVLELDGPAPGAEIAAAYDISRRGQPDIAVDFASLHIPDDHQYVVDVLRANRAVLNGNEDLWLHYLNSYLKNFDLSPVYLKDGGRLIDRFASDACPCSSGPLVSVLMPAWNAQETVYAAACSILNQSWKNLELIIVDDASSDGTWFELQKLTQIDNRVKILRNSVNVGPYVAKNIAASQSAGKWITGHDADDWAHPLRIENQVAFSEASRGPASLAGMVRISEDGQFVRLNPVGNFVDDGACRVGFISLMVHHQYYRDTLGCWDGVRMAGDSEMIHRIQRIEGKELPRLAKVTMLCFDSPDGLTNNAQFGHREGAVSNFRITYKKNFRKYHGSLTPGNCAPLDLVSRKFPAPPEMLNAIGTIETLLDDYKTTEVDVRKKVCCDVAIVTDLRFPGGNASSTLDEIDFLAGQGIKVQLVHCPINDSKERDFSQRYEAWAKNAISSSEVERIDAKVIICRHPRVITSTAFSHLGPRMNCENLFVVKNNSSIRPSGSSVYKIEHMISSCRSVRADKVEFCPISGLMRNELEAHVSSFSSNMSLSSADWNPTFSRSHYENKAKPKMVAPIVIGRHGRDGAEKWIESSKDLLNVYPSNDNFRVDILGGANHVKKILGKIPKNWTVREFGSTSPSEYLSALDVFAYYPNRGLSEGFGRTIVEAMLSNVPVILPWSFQRTFGDLAFYAEPADVGNIVQKLCSAPNAERIEFLNNVQAAADAAYCSDAVRERLRGTSIIFATKYTPSSGNFLTTKSKNFRLKIMTKYDTELRSLSPKEPNGSRSWLSRIISRAK